MSALILRPGLRFAFAHPAHFIALGFGAGASRFAPGTVGTLLGWPMWWLIAHAPAALQFAFVAAAFLLGVLVCGITGRHLGVADHPAMCWDEVVAFTLVLMLVPPAPAWQIIAFLAFRVFDVVKPPPVRDVERRLKGGFGVMADDLLAALYALVTVAVLVRVLD